MFGPIRKWICFLIHTKRKSNGLTNVTSLPVPSHLFGSYYAKHPRCLNGIFDVMWSCWTSSLSVVRLCWYSVLKTLNSYSRHRNIHQKWLFGVVFSETGLMVRSSSKTTTKPYRGVEKWLQNYSFQQEIDLLRRMFLQWLLSQKRRLVTAFIWFDSVRLSKRKTYIY